MSGHEITVRPFTADEWRRFREVRLRALRADPGVFSSNHAREAAKDEAHWRARLSDPQCGVFAVLDGDEVIGMTGVYVPADDPTSAGLWGSWLEPAHRRLGLSHRMYAARIDWARAHPTVERVLVSHRASNVASMQANQRHGFVLTGRATREWPDGRTEDEVCYELRLRDPR